MRFFAPLRMVMRQKDIEGRPGPWHVAKDPPPVGSYRMTCEMLLKPAAELDYATNAFVEIPLSSDDWCRGCLYTLAIHWDEGE